MQPRDDSRTLLTRVLSRRAAGVWEPSSAWRTASRAGAGMRMMLSGHRIARLLYAILRRWLSAALIRAPSAGESVDRGGVAVHRACGLTVSGELTGQRLAFIWRPTSVRHTTILSALVVSRQTKTPFRLTGTKERRLFVVPPTIRAAWRSISAHRSLLFGR